MPRPKKQATTATAAAAGVGAPPPPPMGGFTPPPGVGAPPPPPSMPGAPAGFTPPAPPAVPGIPPAPPTLGQLAHAVPGAPAPVAPPAAPPAGFPQPSLPAPTPMVPPPTQAPVAATVVDLGPVLAKLDDFARGLAGLTQGIDAQVTQSVTKAMEPLLSKVKELFDLSQALYNMGLNPGQQAPAAEEPTQAAPPAQQADAAAGVDKQTAAQVAQSVGHYRGQGYDAAQIAQHFAQTYASQGYPQLTAEVVYAIATQAGMVSADGKLV